MTSFKQSAEEILKNYETRSLNIYKSMKSELLGVGVAFDKSKTIREEALEQLEQLHDDSVQKITINGKNLNEVAIILNGLELERLTSIEVTMKHLYILVDAIRRDLKEANQKAINKAFERFNPHV